jgi:amidohydrolase
MVLHAGLVLQKVADELRAAGARRNVRLLFQPAEESALGARMMIERGELRDVDAILALHVDPFLDVGNIGLRAGALTSACKTFRAMVRGRSGHSARPFEAIDPIPAATSLVDLFYRLGPRSFDSRYPMILNVSTIQAGSSFNGIPDHALIGGTLRAARLLDLEAVRARMERVAEGVGQATGCDIELEFLAGCPATDNDADLIEYFAGAAGDLFGPDSVQRLDVPSLGGEDFAFYQEAVPGAIVRLGSGRPGARRYPLHSSRFDVDESCLSVGTQLFALTTARLACALS